MWRRGCSLFETIIRRRRFEDAMAEEVRFHIEQYTDDLVRSGLSREEAARRARMELGSVDNVKTDCREARGLRRFDELHQDLRYAARRLRKTPGFTATALLTLALCIGANLTLFAVVDSVLLRPLPFPAPDRLVSVFNTYPRAAVANDGCSLPNYYERRGRIAALTSLAAYRSDTAVIGEAGATEREEVMRVSPEFFSTLGSGPILGRAFTEDETTYRTDRVAVLTHAYWRQRLARDPGVVGRRIRVDGLEMTVVGVLSPRFSFLSSKARIYFPLSSNPAERTPAHRHSGGGSRRMIARLAPGATIAQAQSQVDAHNAVVEADNPQAGKMVAAGFRSIVVPLHADHVAAIRPVLLLLQAGGLFLLLIGAVNVTNLLLIRACGRVKELAVRQAIGARRRHVVTEVVAETTLLTLAGGLLGLAVAAAGIRLLAGLGADHLPLGAHITLDGRVALVALAGAIVLGVAMGLPIAWYNLRSHTAHALQSESRAGTASRAAQRMRHGFLVAQIALAFVLLAGAGLLGLSLQKVMALSPGFRPDDVVSGQVVLTVKKHPGARARLAFADRLLEELGRQPGVLSAGVVTNLPFSGNSGKSAAKVQGHALQPGESPQGHYSYGVGGEYFAALGFTLREGRFLAAADSHRAERVCVVDEDFARHYWPGGGAIGQRLFWGSEEGSDADAFAIVGVVGAVKQADLSEDGAQGAIYYPYGYGPTSNDIFLVARTRIPLGSLGITLRNVVRKVDPDVPLTDLRSMGDRVADSLVARRSPALLAGLFSGVAVLLTAIGTYGVLSYAVAQRRREIGVRMALGARPEQVRGQFVSLALRLLAAGTTLGLIGTWLTGQAMQAVLFQVPVLHPATLGGTAGILGVVSLVACLVPSRRAARISPIEALTDQ